jgi:hypothetical protein
MSASHSSVAMETTMPDTETVLSWVHFGDLGTRLGPNRNGRKW